MAKFLFQPCPIDKVNFKPLAIDLNKEPLKQLIQKSADFQLNNTESVIVGTDKEEILSRIQRGFEYQFNQHGKLKKEDISAQIIKPCRHGKEYKTCYIRFKHRY